MAETTVASSACVVFCNINNLIGICKRDSMANDCKIVDNPPKLITKVAPTIAHKPERF